MNGARDTVSVLDVKFWESVFREDRGIGDVTDGGLFNHVTDHESLDGLVLWHTSVAVDATDMLNVSSSVLVATIVTSLLSLQKSVCVLFVGVVECDEMWFVDMAGV